MGTKIKSTYIQENLDESLSANTFLTPRRNLPYTHENHLDEEGISDEKKFSGNTTMNLSSAVSEQATLLAGKSGLAF